MKSFKAYLKDNFYLDIMTLFFFFLSFFIEPLISLRNGQGFVFNLYEQVFKGYWHIITSPSILTTDYVYIAGLGATFFNVASILLINLLLIKFLKVKITGPVYAGLIMICGFSFFGKNIFNALPIYLGIYLYALFRKIEFRSLILNVLFSTGISPVVSYAIFGMGLELYWSIPLGILIGVVVGFILPAFTSHTIAFHHGYNLYNTGFALGIIAVCFNGILLFFNHHAKSVELYDYSASGAFYYILPIISLMAIIIALVCDHQVLTSYRRLLKTTGRLVSDYATEFNRETVLFNFGVLGLFIYMIILIFKIPVNGVIFGSILAILGFSGYGLHLRNVLPVWLGAGVTIYFKCLLDGNFNLSVAYITFFVFASGLAPIAGRYGIVFGFLAGMLHIIIAPLMIGFQGGFDLYNNGFSAGFVGGLLCVLAEKVFKRNDKRRHKSKK